MNTAGQAGCGPSSGTHQKAEARTGNRLAGQRSRMKWHDWFWCGVADRRERTPYLRAPGPEHPRLPREEMPEEWQHYFDGWGAESLDAAARTMNAARAKRGEEPLWRGYRYDEEAAC